MIRPLARTPLACSNQRLNWTIGSGSRSRRRNPVRLYSLLRSAMDMLAAEFRSEFVGESRVESRAGSALDCPVLGQRRTVASHNYSLKTEVGTFLRSSSASIL